MTRLIYINVLLFLALANGFASAISDAVNRNMFNLLAAATGALVIRFIWPRVPVLTSIGGWLVGFLLACQFGPSAVKSEWFYWFNGVPFEPEAQWGIIALLGDIIIQLIGWIVRLLKPIGDYTVAHPGQAFNQGLDYAERGLNTWGRIRSLGIDFAKTGYDFVKTIFSKKEQ